MNILNHQEEASIGASWLRLPNLLYYNFIIPNDKISFSIFFAMPELILQYFICFSLPTGMVKGNKGSY